MYNFQNRLHPKSQYFLATLHNEFKNSYLGNYKDITFQVSIEHRAYTSTRVDITQSCRGWRAFLIVE